MSRVETLPAVTRSAVPAVRSQAPDSMARQFLGGDDERVQIARLHIFQNQAEERQKYGERKEGELFNVITGETIGDRASLPTKKFIVLFYFRSWIRFTDNGVAYQERDKSKVPPEDLKWDRTDPMKPEKPLATEFMNWVVVFEDTYCPVILSFKSTSLSTGEAIEMMEKGRRFEATLKKTGKTKTIGFYALSLRPKTKGTKTWLHPEVRPMGDATPEMQELHDMMLNSFSAERVDVDLVDEVPAEDEPAAAGGKSDPIAAAAKARSSGGKQFNPDDPAF